MGHLLPIPQDGGDGSTDDPNAQLKLDLAAGRGRTLLVETTSAGHGEGRMSAPQQDWVSSRFGADPPLSLGSLRGDAAKLAPVRFDFSGLWAHDLAGRGAAFAKMVQGGMELRAAVLSGLTAKHTASPACDGIPLDCPPVGSFRVSPDGPLRPRSRVRSRGCWSPAPAGSGSSSGSPDRCWPSARHRHRRTSPRPRRAPASVRRAAGPSAPASPRRGRSRDGPRPGQQAHQRRIPSG